MNGPGVAPDVMAVAKALGNGFPIGACLATEKAAVGMVPGTHGSTFGGNPLAVAAGNAVMDVMLEPGFFERVQRVCAGCCGAGSQTLVAGLSQAVRRAARLRASARHPLPSALTAGDFVAKLRDEGLLCLTAGENVLRILPPLIVSEAEIEDGAAILNKVAREWPAA